MSFSGETWGKVKKWTRKEIESAQLNPMTEKGTWNASTNTPTLSHGTGTNGWWYTVVVAGTNLDDTFAIGDVVKYDGSISKWVKVAYSTSIKGEKGDKGDTGEIEEATVSLDTSGTEPSVEIVNGGTPTDRSFNFKFKNIDCQITGAEATIDNKVGIPEIKVIPTGTGNRKKFTFNFKNMKGEKGEQGENAVTALNARGDYDVNADPAYTKSDYITGNDGNSYVCKKDNPNNVAPTTGRKDDEYWQIMALKGAKGEKGDAGGISDDESAKLIQMNESKYNVRKGKLFNLNDDESHLLFQGTLKTAKTDIQEGITYELMELPDNPNIVYPNEMMLQITTPQGNRTNMAMKDDYFDSTGSKYIDKTAIRNKTYNITSWKVIVINDYTYTPVASPSTSSLSTYYEIDDNNLGYKLTSDTSIVSGKTYYTKSGSKSDLVYYDKRGNQVLAAEESEAVSLAYGEEKTVYLTDFEGADAGFIDGGASYQFGDGTGRKLYDANGVEIGSATGLATLHKVKAIQVSIDEDFIYWNLLEQAGCEVNEDGYMSRYGLSQTQDEINLSVASHEVNSAGLPSSKKGFKGTYNVQLTVYDAATQQVASATQKIEPTYTQTTDVQVVPTKTYYIYVTDHYEVIDTNISHYYELIYELTEDTEIIQGKDYYTRTGEEGSYVYTLVENPVVEDIETYYELVYEHTEDTQVVSGKTYYIRDEGGYEVVDTDITHYYEKTAEGKTKVFISGSNCVSGAFISQMF